MPLSQGADVNAREGFYGNVLIAASEGGHKQIATLLLDHRANVIAQRSTYHGNTLHMASQRGYEEIVKLLLDQGVDINAQCGYYGNALQVASEATSL